MKKLIFTTLLTLSFNAFAAEESKTPEAEAVTKTAEEWFRAGALEEYFESLFQSPMMKKTGAAPNLKEGYHAHIVSIGRRLDPTRPGYVWTWDTWNGEEIAQSEFNERASVCSFGQVIEGDLNSIPNPFGEIPIKTAEEWFRAGSLDNAFLRPLPSGVHAAILSVGKLAMFGGVVWTAKNWFNTPITYSEFFQRATACTLGTMKAKPTDIPSPFWLSEE